MSVGSLSSTHLLVHCVSTDIISLSRFESTGISNGEVVSDGSLSVRILLDGISVDMVMVKRERLVGNYHSSDASSHATVQIQCWTQAPINQPLVARGRLISTLVLIKQL